MASQRRSLAWMMHTAIPGVVPGVAMSPLVVMPLLLACGAPRWQCLALALVPQTAILAALPLSWWLERWQPRTAFLAALAAARLSLALGLAALLVCPPPQAGDLLLLAFVIHSVAIAAGSGSCLAWFQRLLPSLVQGTYLGRRNAISAAAGGLVTLAFTALLAHPHAVGAAGVATAGALVFAGGLLLSAVDAACLCRVGPGRNRPEGEPPARPLAQRLRAPGLWRAVMLPVVAGAGGLIAAPVSLLVYFDLGLDALQVSLVGIAGMAGGVLGFWAGARACDRLPPERILPLTSLAQGLGLALLPVVMALAANGSLAGRSLVLACCGLAVATAIPAAWAANSQTKLLFSALPGAAAGDFALVSTLRGVLAAAVSALAGGLVLAIESHPGSLRWLGGAGQPTLVLLVLGAVGFVGAGVWLRGATRRRHQAARVLLDRLAP